MLEIIQENDCFLTNFEQNKSSACVKYVNIFYEPIFNEFPFKYYTTPILLYTEIENDINFSNFLHFMSRIV